MSKPGAAVRAAGWVTVGVIAAGGVATAATASSDSSTPSGATPPATSTEAPAAAAAAKHPRAAGALAKLKGRLLHGEATVVGKDNKPVVLSEQRGTVDAVSPTSITLSSTDGFKQTYIVTPTTKVRVDGAKSTIAAVKPGQTAAVIAKVDGTTQTAQAVVERAAK